MRRWIFFAVTFLTFSALFLLASGEYGGRGKGPGSAAEGAEPAAGDDRFVVQIVDQTKNVLRARLWARGVDLMGDLVELESIQGLHLEAIEMEIYESGGRRLAHVTAPTGRVVKRGGSAQGMVDLDAEFAGGVAIEIPLLESEATLRTEAVRLTGSGSGSDRKRLLFAEDLEGRRSPIVIEGVDPFLRIEAGGAEADLSDGTRGSIRLLPPFRAEADAALARKLWLLREAKISREDRIEIRSEAPVRIEGFLSKDGKPAVSPEGETRIVFEGRTKITGPVERGGELETDHLEIQFVETQAPAEDGRTTERERPPREGVGLGRAKAAGNVVFRHRNSTLEAGAVEWDPASESAVATGGPTLRDKAGDLEREIGADRITFYPGEYRVYLDGHVAGKLTVPPGTGEAALPSTVWQFLADHLQLEMEKDEATRKLGLSWGEAWTDEGGPLVISDKGEGTLITGQRLSFNTTKASLFGGENPCLLRHGESRFWAERVDLDLHPGSVTLSGECRGSIHPEDIGEHLPAGLEGQEIEKIDITADEIALEIRLQEEAAAPGEGQGKDLPSRIRSVRARGWNAPAKIEAGARGVEGKELVWDLENDLMTAAGGGESRPHFWDEKMELRAGSVEVRKGKGKAHLRGGVRGTVTDTKGRSWQLGAETLEITFSLEDGEGAQGWGGEILHARARGKEGKRLWMEGEAGRIEGGEAEWNHREGWLRLSGVSGCTFSGSWERGARVDLRAGKLEVNIEERWAELSGAILGTLTPSRPSTGDPEEDAKLRKAEEELRRAGKDPHAPWTIRCENARIAYDLEEEEKAAATGLVAGRPVIREFEADGGEGLVVIESPENAIRLAGTHIVYEEKSGWMRMTGSEAFEPRLELGEEGENVIIAQKVALHIERREMVFEGPEKDVRVTFHSETIRKVIPKASEEVPGLLWELTASKVVVRVPEAWSEVGRLDLEASGPVHFRAGELEVEADRVTYDGQTETIIFEGDPVRATDGDKSGTAKWVEFDLLNQRIRARGAKGWTIDPRTLERIMRGKK